VSEHQHPNPGDPEWSQWATLCNDLSDALKPEPAGMLFSARRRVAERMWAAGYRPTPDAVQRVIERQRAAMTAQEGA